MVFVFNVPNDSDATKVKSKTEEFLKSQFGIQEPEVELLNPEEVYALNNV